jgi:hypothetical protein
MKIPIDPKIAVETLKQIVPQMEEFIEQLQFESEIFFAITQFAKKAGLDGYPQLYLDKQNILKLSLLTLLPVDQINVIGETFKTLSPEDTIAFANQTVQNFNQSPEKLDAILDTHFPDNFDKVDPTQLTAQAKIVLTGFFLFFHDTVSFLAHGRRITDLIQSAINGDDEAFCLAVQTDHLVLTIPYFRDRINKALYLQTDEDAKFIYNLSYRMQNPVMRGKIKHRNVWIALLLLDSMNLLDGSLTRTELLAMLDEAQIEGVESEDNLSRMLRRFRAYQNEV